ncbi:hypothetical protein HNQ41_000049 [Texcoconibacillus texcoconensis]|uniref:Uncharacterized protein n=1 Tax=Texcoconibacillus texcoconensis TaxID=1095777 RepID=A0A840QIH9_9BACI|nr:hypothetical protein [Texcoconibacillus texcoconensis]
MIFRQFLHTNPVVAVLLQIEQEEMTLGLC